jgi:hypothetical protein
MSKPLLHFLVGIVLVSPAAYSGEELNCRFDFYPTVEIEKHLIETCRKDVSIECFRKAHSQLKNRCKEANVWIHSLERSKRDGRLNLIYSSVGYPNDRQPISVSIEFDIDDKGKIEGMPTFSGKRACDIKSLLSVLPPCPKTKDVEKLFRMKVLRHSPDPRSKPKLFNQLSTGGFHPIKECRTREITQIQSDIYACGPVQQRRRELKDKADHFLMIHLFFDQNGNMAGFAKKEKRGSRDATGHASDANMDITGIDRQVISKIYSSHFKKDDSVDNCEVLTEERMQLPIHGLMHAVSMSSTSSFLSRDPKGKQIPGIAYAQMLDRNVAPHRAILCDRGIYFGLPGYDETKTKAVTFASLDCGGLCGSGYLVYLEKNEDNSWKIKWKQHLWSK